MLILSLVLTSSLVLADTTYQGNAYYIGDPHQHTGVSGDGESSDLGGCGAVECGSLAAVFELARDNGLDWLALSDHTNGGHEADPDAYTTLLEMALEHDDEATGLVVVPAAELVTATEERGLGHRNLYLFGSDEQLEDLNFYDTRPTEDGLGVTECGDIASWLDGLEDDFGPALLIPHHSNVTTPMAVFFGCFDPVHEVAVEVYSSWGNHLGGELHWWDTPTVGWAEGGDVTHAMAPDDMALRFGFMGGSDAHVTLPGDLCIDIPEHHVGTGGLTIIVAPEEERFDRAAIHQALVEHRSYATTGPMVPLALAYHSAGELVATLGQDIQLTADEDLSLTVSIPDSWTSSVLDVLAIMPNDALSLEPVDDESWSTSLDPGTVPPWIFVAVQIDMAGSCDDGGDDAYEWLFVSPTWIDVDVPEDTAPGDTSPGPIHPRSCTCQDCSSSGSNVAGWVTLLAGLLGLAVLRRGPLSSLHPPRKQMKQEAPEAPAAAQAAKIGGRGGVRPG